LLLCPVCQKYLVGTSLDYVNRTLKNLKELIHMEDVYDKQKRWKEEEKEGENGIS